MIERSSTPLNAAAARRGAVALLGLLLAVGLIPGRAAAAPVSERAESERPRAYWTAERMRAATPVELPMLAGAPEPDRASARVTTQARSEVRQPADPPFRAHGKVFFTVPGEGDFVCSGTSVTSGSRSLVWTAGHCVFDDVSNRFATNWTFVPGYHEGRAPFGRWPARQLATTQQWQRFANIKYDLGAAVVRRNDNGRGLQDIVGARGIGFNQPRNQTYSAFGYPTVQPPFGFDGERMFRCDSRFGGNDNPGGSGPATMWIRCDQTAGSSGGGWVAGNAVLSVNSYKYLLQSDRMYGPYMDGIAQQLYSAVRGRAVRCLRRPVTHLGGPGDDLIRGTRGADVIRVRRGDNRILSKGGNDRICGGAGRDVIRAGPGDNRIRAGRRNDRIFVGGGDNRIRALRGRNRIRCGRGRDRVVTNRRSIVRGCSDVIRR